VAMALLIRRYSALAPIPPKLVGYRRGTFRVSTPAFQTRMLSLALRSSIDDRNAVVEETVVPTVDPSQTKKISKTQLKEDLKKYRLEQSTPLNKPPYTVFNNAAMEGIYKSLPTTKEELLEVKGIGPKKLEMFGDDILSIVSKYATGSLEEGSFGKKDSIKIQRPSIIDPEMLTAEQRYAADLALNLDRCSNVFITGAAGTGKSHVLKYIIQELQKRRSNFGVCAPTGVAAINVGGSTLHSYFGIGLGTGSLSSLIKKVTKNNEAMKRIDGTDFLCIDECSMLSSFLLEQLDALLREVRHDGHFRDEPFGGITIIAIGDFFQLPPVYNGGDMDRDWRPFCFESPVWSDLGLSENTVILENVQRQGSNKKFIQFLNMVRVGNIEERILRDFNAKCLISAAHPLPTDGIVPSRLYVLNKDVDSENESRLAALKAKEVICKASNEWKEQMPTGTLVSVKKKMKESIEKEVPEEIRLKLGAQVMLTRNKDLDRNLVNGSRGIVEGFVQDADGDVIPVVRFDCGVTDKLSKVETMRYNPDGEMGCLVRKQIPLKLAWALTIHKSQGSTLTRALLNLESTFEYGQMYVALSRVRSMDGLWLEQPASIRNIMVSPQVLDYYNKILE